MYVYRFRGSRGNIDVEDLFRLFLIDTFNSEFMYIISPWVTSFRLTKKVIYYPFISSYSVVDILNALKDNGVKVFLLTRCFDDALSPDVVYILYKIKEGSIRLSPALYKFLRNQVNFMYRRLEYVEKIIGTGINCKFDIGVQDRESQFRLHAKIYVNDKYALLGSANFTRSGIVRGGHWECLVRINSDSKIYYKILESAIKLYNAGRSYEECLRRITYLVTTHFGDNVKINGIQDIKNLLKELLYSQ